MKLNRAAKKKGFLGFKIDESEADEFRKITKSKGGASAVLQRFVHRYVRRARSDKRAA